MREEREAEPGQSESDVMARGANFGEGARAAEDKDTDKRRRVRRQQERDMHTDVRESSSSGGGRRNVRFIFRLVWRRSERPNHKCLR